MKKFYLILTTLFSIFSMTVWGQEKTGGQEESVVDPPTPAISQPKAWFEYIQPNQFGGNNFASAVKVYAFEPQQLAGSSTQSDAEFMAEYINSHLDKYMAEISASTVTKEVATGFFKEAIDEVNETYYNKRVDDIFAQYSINEDVLNSKLVVKLKYIPKTSGSKYSGSLPSSAYSLKVAGPMTVAGSTIPDWKDLPVDEDLTKNNQTTINLTKDEISYGQFLIMQNFYAGLINNDPIKNEGENIEIAFFRENSSDQLASSNFVFSTVASITTNDVTEYYSHIANAIYKVVTDFMMSSATKNDQIIKLTKDEYIEKDNELAIPETIDNLVFTTDYDNHSLQASTGHTVVFNIKGNTSNYMKMINPAVFVDINLEGLTSVVNGGIFGSEEKSIAVTVTNGDLAIFSGDFTHATITKQDGGTGKITIYGGTFGTQPNKDWIAPGYMVKALGDNIWIVLPQQEKIEYNSGVDITVESGATYDDEFGNEFLSKVFQCTKANSYQSTNIADVLETPDGGISNFLNVKLVSAQYRELKNDQQQVYPNGKYFDYLTYMVTPQYVKEDGTTDVVPNYGKNLHTTVAKTVNFILPVCSPLGENSVAKYQYAKIFRVFRDSKGEITRYSFVNDVRVNIDNNTKETTIEVNSASLGEFLCVLSSAYEVCHPTYADFSSTRMGEKKSAVKITQSDNIAYMNYRTNYKNQLLDVSAPNISINGLNADMIEYAHISNNVIYKDNNTNKYICPGFILDDNPQNYGGLFLPEGIIEFTALTGSYQRGATSSAATKLPEYNSVCLPFTLNEKDINGKIGVYDKQTQSGGATVAVFTEKSSVPAGTPCVVQTKEENWNIDLAGRTISVPGDASEYKKDGNLMVGTFTAKCYTRTTELKQCYKLESGEFNPFWDQTITDTESSEYLYIFAFRAYLDLTGTDASATKAMAIMWEDEADGISELRQDVQFDGNAMNATMFNLNGQPVSKDYKGVVIVGGKKMLKK